ncbi:SepM family pheromone-processing serine protease [Enterococcus sp. HY326]|uniref:SepM family pheromone-processing serine protease n=1 Tax=Enterococcus sp. HY326 TaxID=2971265 RepID=UPI002240855E|nr:SepM family pheromone-processing serine protease [Enterococcus sp. HY326]
MTEKNNTLKNFFKKKQVKIGSFVLLFLLALAFVGLPLPYYVQSPGSTIDLKSMVTINGEEDTEEGSFSLTSVAYRRATPVLLLWAQFNEFADVESVQEMRGDASSEEYNQMQQYLMTAAKNSAIQEAFNLAGVEYTFAYKGIYVMSVQDSSNFYGDLAVGDTITQADGQTFASQEDFMAYVKAKNIGDDLTITYYHDGEERTATEELITLSAEDGTETAGIGITLVEDTELESDTTVEIDTGSIGGPSAGLMFTLEIYDQLTEGDLRHGQQIAGTGTIDSEGNVGQIGGIDKKVVSASQSGAAVFFAPTDGEDYEDAVAAAKKIGTDMEIVPVTTVQDALDYLNGLTD